MKIKSPTTCDEQITLLKQRGLIFENEEKALMVLDTLNYYVLSGYLHGYKKPDGSYENDLTFEKVYALYKFDNALRNILLFSIERIEQLLKARISTAIALSYPDDPCIYESSDLFKDRFEHIKFMRSFELAVRHNRNVPFVKHHIDNYDQHFPIWVAVELFTLGNIKHLYSNLPNRIRKTVGSKFDVSPIILDSWIENLRITRNSLAHNMRIYGSTYMNTPKMPPEVYCDLAARHRIFDHVYLMGILYPDREEWGSIVRDIKSVLSEYEKEVELQKIGFPEDWERIVSL